MLKWLRNGWIDYVTPQIYWHIGFEVAEYKTLAQWWNENAYGKHLYIGQGIYRIGEKGWEDKNEIIDQIQYNRSFPKIKGSMYFSARTIAQNKLGVNEKLAELYPYPALIPTMPWIDQQAPAAPETISASGSQGEGIRLEWEDPISEDQAYYVIYRFENGDPIDLENPAHILAKVPRIPQTVQTWTDPGAQKRTTYSYHVTAVDRLHNESYGSAEVTLRTRGSKGKIRLR